MEAANVLLGSLSREIHKFENLNGTTLLGDAKELYPDRNWTWKVGHSPLSHIHVLPITWVAYLSVVFGLKVRDIVIVIVHRSEITSSWKS